MRRTLVFVHGWSVRNTKTYGGLPERLEAEGRGRGLEIDARHVFLGRYVSFRDEVRMADLARAFDAALEEQGLDSDVRFVAITHSTGGPVVRTWLELWRSRAKKRDRCPCSHLVMLAPANFGSALAALGRSRVGRIKAWMDGGVEPGQGVLDWLELGSPESFELNSSWIRGEGVDATPSGCFPFVLTGQVVDSKLYDHLNNYTGEVGSDGVVRAAAANLNSSFVRLVQGAGGDSGGGGLEIADRTDSPESAFRMVPGVSHSGARIGILRSVKKDLDRDHPVVEPLLRCLEVTSTAQYRRVVREFAEETHTVIEEEREGSVRVAFVERDFERRPRTMVTFRVVDSEGRPIEDFDLLLLAPNRRGDLDPGALPEGFFVDRQRNRHHPGTLTLFLDHALMAQLPRLGLVVRPRPDEGFVHYAEARFESTGDELVRALQPHRTTLVEIVLRRIVREGAFRLDRGFARRDFTRTKPGAPIRPTP